MTIQITGRRNKKSSTPKLYFQCCQCCIVIFQLFICTIHLVTYIAIISRHFQTNKTFFTIYIKKALPTSNALLILSFYFLILLFLFIFSEINHINNANIYANPIIAIVHITDTYTDCSYTFKKGYGP